jgi:nitroreductase
MDIDVGAVDHALTTTRAVRRRLDLERTVDNQIILDCIDVAEQAPTGGNLSSRRWLVIREPRLKQALADLYMAGAGQWMANAADRLKGTGDPQEKNMASAKHLAENLANVPAIVIPTIIGRHDGSGRPGLFDSVIQSGWSFCVALRARGLGTAWVTAALADQEKVKELLGIPEHMTEIAMFPVAWTKGTDFSPAPRPPARTVTFFDGWAQTFESGPSNPVRLVDGPGTVAEVDINAPAAAIWPFLTDIGLSSRFSNEFQGAEWVAGTLVGGQPIVGSSFVGTNENPSLGEFKVPSFIDTYEQDVAFGWRTSSVENPGARWRFEIEPNGSGSRLRYTAALGPGPSGLTIAIESMPDKEHRIIYRRIEGLYANMRKVVVGIKKLAEATES